MLLGPQTLRQFAAEALGGGGDNGEQVSYQTPRSRIGDDGLPVSPGGTVIRPPPGPPPLSPRPIVASAPGPAVGPGLPRTFRFFRVWGWEAGGAREVHFRTT